MSVLECDVVEDGTSEIEGLVGVSCGREVERRGRERGLYRRLLQ